MIENQVDEDDEPEDGPNASFAPANQWWEAIVKLVTLNKHSSRR
jgi:hypothetical protein